MPDAPTPGALAYTVWERTLHAQGRLTTVGQWASLGRVDQAVWEAAAQAVLEACAVLCPICGAELERCNAEHTP